MWFRIIVEVSGAYNFQTEDKKIEARMLNLFSILQDLLYT
jgi:hypothetical protein